MYKLEDRILFDGAAVADVAEAQKEAEAQQEAAAQAAAEAEEAAAQQNDSNDSNDSAEHNDSEASDHSSLQEVLAAVNADGLGADGQRVDVLVVSSSLENADDICNTADADTIVVRYDARTTSAADLLQQITDALNGNVADSIAFATESGETAAIQLFADTDTSLDTVNNAAHQDFFNGLDALLDEGGDVNFLASNLASTAEGEALVDAIGDAIGHDVAASSDETGSANAGGDWDLEYSTDGIEKDAASLYLDENLVDNFDALLEDHVSHEVVFINSSVMNVDEILDDLGDNVEVVMLEQGDAFQQITDYLQDKTGIDGIHIISHGNKGFFRLGNDTIDAQFVQEHQADFTTWGHSLTNGGDIMIYGCNLAAETDGQNLIQKIADFTGADVAASTDSTGVSGDWELECTVGNVETAALAVHDYMYSLANITVNNITDDPFGTLGTGVYTLRKAIAEAEAGDEIIFAAWVGTLDKTKPAGADVANYTVYLNASLGQIDIDKNITINGYITLPDGAHTFVRVDARPLVEVSPPTDPVTWEPGTATTRVFFIKAVSDADNYVTLKNMIVQNGHAVSTGGTIPSDGDGGGIYIDVNSKVVMNEVTVQTSTADISGGGIYNAGILHIERTIDEDTTAVSNNTAGNSGGAIFNGSTGTLTVVGLDVNHEVEIKYNTATTGSGGGIYSVDDIDVRLTWLEYNTAVAGSGGAIAIENGAGDSYFYQIEAHHNTAYVNGGGISYTQGNSVIIEWSKFEDNTATTGSGGGLYFANNSGSLTIRTTDGTYGANTHTYFNDNTAAVSGGGLYVDQSGNLNIDFVEFKGNTAGIAIGYGGAICMQNSGNINIYEGDFDSNRARYGGGIYYDGSGSMSISASDIVNNSSGNTWQGGAIYQLTGALTIINTTLAYNNASYGGSIYMGDNSTLSLSFATVAYNSANTGYAIYMTNSAGSSFSSIDSIYFNTGATVGNEITLGSSVTVSSSNYNVYSRYGGSKFAGTGNITDPTLIQNELYLDTVLRRQGNYRTQTLALLYKESVAYTAGISVSGIIHDQRGNNRVGTDVNGKSNGTPSIGAFEPIYYITVSSKGDVSSLQWDNSQGGHYFSEAQEDGITLREAIYWIDNYNRQQAYDAGLYDADRWVKFDATLFAADSDNTISITQGQIEIGDMRYGFAGQAKEVMLSSVEVVNPLDTRDYGDINDPVAFRAQNASGRIIVDGNDNDSIFSIANTSATFYINNITITNGHETNDSDGVGGGLQNRGYIIFNNVVVSNCIADNSDSDATYSSGGFGGGIYNTGTMHIYDSTITGNSAIAYASDKYQPSRAGLGGGIYNTGTLTIERSTINNNSVSGNIQYVTNESLVGAGIYNTIQTQNWIIWNGHDYDPEVRKVTGSGTLNIANSTITENTATATQASSDTNPAGSGSAIYMKDGDLTLYYNTIVNNHTNLHSGATASDSKAAVSAWGGMEYSFTWEGKTDTYTSSVNLYLSNSILANNTVQVTSSPPVQKYLDIYINNTSTTTNVTVINSPPIGDYNIIGSYNYDSTTGDGYDWNVRNNQVGDSFGYVVDLNIDSQLRYNGAKTMTYRLLDGSVAVGTGSLLTSAPYTSAFTSLATDQRGVSRTMADRNGNIVQNVGSYESLTLLTITSQKDSGVEPTTEGFDFKEDKPGWETDEVSFRDAIYWADTEALITIDATSWTGATVKLAKALTISTGITINGELLGMYQVILDAEKKGRVFIVDNIDYLPLVSVGLQNMILQNGNASSSSYSGHGGAIYSKETLTITNVVIKNNTAAGKGGGIFSQTGDLNLYQSTISSNTARTGAGGIYTEANTLYTYQSSILNNKTTNGDGGGIYALGANVNIEASTIGLNTATAGHGGGLYINSSSFTMLNSTISNNTAGLNGGGISFYSGGTYNINFSTIANNISGYAEESQYYGGGLYLAAGNLTISNSVIANNYHYSIAEANRDDFYLFGGNVTNATYNAIGVSTGYVFDVTTDHNITYADNPDFFNELRLDTTLTDNGGPTLTLYVSNRDTILQDHADQATTVTVDQRGAPRNPPNITIGAYQIPSPTESTYYYVGTDGDVTKLTNWENSLHVNPTDMNIPGQTFVFDNDTVHISVDWDLIYKNTVVVQAGSNIYVDSTDVSINLDIELGGLFVVNGGIFATASTPIVNSGTFTVNGGISSGQINLKANSFLKLNAAGAAWENLNFGSIDNTSTVEYIYSQAQTVRAGTYGNLILSNSSKNLAGAIIVNGNLDVTTGTVFNAGSYTVAVAAEATIGGTVNSSGTFSVAGLTTMTDSGYLNGKSVTLDGGITASGSSTIKASSSFTFDNTADITVAASGKLTMDMNNRDIYIRTAPVLATDFDADHLDVAATGELVFLTTGDIYTFVPTAPSALLGSLTLTGNDLDLSGGAIFTNAAMLTLNNSGTLTLGPINAKAITFGGDITLGADPTNIGEPGSRIGSVLITGNVYGNGNAFNIYTTGDIRLASVLNAGAVTTDSTGGIVYLGNITATSITVTNNNSVSLSGTINVTGNAELGSGNITLTNDATVQADDITLTGSINSDGVAPWTLTWIEAGGINFTNVVGNLNIVSLALESQQGAVHFTPASLNVNNLGITAATSINLPNDFSTGGNLTLSSGTTVTAGVNITVGGNLNASAGTTANLNDLVINGGGNASFSGGTITIQNLTMDGGNLTNGAALTVSGNLNGTIGNLTNTNSFTADSVTATGNIINSGTLDVILIFADGYLKNTGSLSAVSTNIGGNITNSGSLDSTTVTVGGNLSNTGTFIADILQAGGNITSTKYMEVDELYILGDSKLSFSGTVKNFSVIAVDDDINATLTKGNISTDTFGFLGYESGSTFKLGSGTSLTVATNLDYNIRPSGEYYGGNYFNTSGGGKLVRTMTGSDVAYRVGNNNYVVVVTLNGTTGEKIAVGVINGVTVNGETVIGIEETVKFTTNIDRNYGGGSYSNDLILGIDWATAMEGSEFDTTDASLFNFSNGEWTAENKLTITEPSTGRHAFSNYVLDHNGTYTVANTGGDITVPPIPNNVNIYEMANAHFMPMYTDLDCNIFLNFPVGVYPYFTYDIWVTPENSDSVGQAVYRQMEYRLISNPLTNPLYGQVPPPGAVLGQAITEQASLTLTADAPIYLEVNGEYSVGKEWLPITEPATVENIGEFQEPITQGQIDQFYLDFGDREDIFEKPAPFKSDLDELLDNLLAG